MLKHTHIKTLLAILLLPLAAALASCHNQPEEPKEPPAPPEKNATRTILVYMVANNNLGRDNFDRSDITEMQLAAASEKGYGEGNVLIYRIKRNSDYDIDVHLYKVGPNSLDTLKIYDNSIPSVSIERMREVISDTKELAPADSYGMVFWSHGSGWLQDGISEPLKAPGISTYSFGSDKYGNSEEKKMDITSVAAAIEDAGFDFLYFDCCYMGSVETLYELRHCAPYIIASPAEVPPNGMPYNLNLPVLLDIDTPLEEALITSATNTFNSYNDVFKKGDCPNTMAVIKTSALDDLAVATRRIYEKATFLSNPTISYQRFTLSSPCYYYDLEQYVESVCADDADMALWREALAGAVIYADASPWIWASIAIEHYCGLSTYIMTSPASASTQNYNELAWYADVAAALIK